MSKRLRMEQINHSVGNNADSYWDARVNQYDDEEEEEEIDGDDDDDGELNPVHLRPEFHGEEEGEGEEGEEEEEEDEESEEGEEYSMIHPSFGLENADFCSFTGRRRQ